MDKYINHYDMRHLTIIILALLFHPNTFAQEGGIVFPTGMKWKESVVEPGQPTDPALTVDYEIGNDIAIRGATYKEIYKNGKRENYWIREADGIVWLLTEEYGREIKLYDFNWHAGAAVSQEYLREENGNQTLEAEEFIPDASCLTVVGSHDYTYHHQFGVSIICGIGRVADLYRNSCLLGYKKAVPSLPGVLFQKVMLVTQDGKEVFRSDSPEDWTFDIPSGIMAVGSSAKVSKDVSDLQGRRLTVQPRRGLYIRDGRKYVAR